MKALTLYGPKDIRLEEQPMPDLSQGDLLIKVMCAAICGTDIRAYQYGIETAPLIIGHEFSGIVTEVGASAVGYQPGDRVSVAPNYGCGLCEQCVSGNTQLCPDYQAFGINNPGAFAEYIRIPEITVRQGNVFKLADSIGFAEAAVNEPLSCVYNGFEKCRIRPGDTVLIIGAGPIGIMHALLADMAGAGQVIMNDLNKTRLKECQAVLPSIRLIGQGDLRQKIMTMTGGRGVDVCITACPSPAAQQESLNLMAIGGRINFFGGIPKEKQPVALDTNLIHYKQLLVTGSARANLSQYRKTLRLIETDRIPVRKIITHQFPFDQAVAAIDSASHGIGLKTVLMMT